MRKAVEGGRGRGWKWDGWMVPGGWYCSCKGWSMENMRDRWCISKVYCSNSKTNFQRYRYIYRGFQKRDANCRNHKAGFEERGRRYQKEKLDFSGKHPQNPELSRMLLQKHLKWWAIKRNRSSKRASMTQVL